MLCTKANYLAEVVGYDIHIVVRESPQTTFFLFSPKIQIHYLGLDRLKHKPWMVFGSTSRKEYQKRLFQKLEEIRPDITVSVFGLDAEFLYKATDGSVKVLEFHFSKNYLKHLGNSLTNDKYRLLRKWWMIFLSKKEVYYSSKYAHVVLLTEKDKQLWGGGDKFTVIPNPLSFRAKGASSLKKKQIIAIGSYIPQKGFDLLLDAFGLIASGFPDWQLHIYGAGQDKQMLQDKINILSLQRQVSLKEPTEDIARRMIDASVFAFSSRYEGFGLVLIEAMECGLPSVSFDCECGPSEILNHGTSGFLVPSWNVSLFADALKELMQNEELRIEMGRCAKKEVRRFYPENIAPLWTDFFTKLKEVH